MARVHPRRWFPERVNLDALRIAYGDLAALAVSLDEDASWRPTACAGWAVRDLVHHLLGDAHRALVALATPSSGPVDRDSTTYWLDSPGAPDADSRGIRAVRSMASQWRLEISDCHLRRDDYRGRNLGWTRGSGDLVVTQGHVLSVGDLLATLVVEATIHHLDMTVDVDSAGPHPEPVAITRDTVDGLLGRSTPEAWNNEQWVRAATGRDELLEEQRSYLGLDVKRLPLLR